jgi:hypothetical protein
MSESHPSTITEQVTFDALEDDEDGCWCDDHSMPCFECFQTGRRDLPGEGE